MRISQQELLLFLEYSENFFEQSLKNNPMSAYTSIIQPKQTHNADRFGLLKDIIEGIGKAKGKPHNKHFTFFQNRKFYEDVYEKREEQAWFDCVDNDLHALAELMGYKSGYYEWYNKVRFKFISGILTIDEDFIATQKALPFEEDKRTKFYLAQKQDNIQFWGLCNGLGVKNTIEDKFFEDLRKNYKANNARIIGRVTGSGGMGKTTFLRQIALRWVQETGKPVFWIEVVESLGLDGFLQDLPEDGALVVVDDVANSDSANHQNSVLKQVKQYPHLRWLLGSRQDMPILSQSGWMTSLHYEFDKEQERLKALNRGLLEKLNYPIVKESLLQAKPFQLLFVLIRNQDKENSEKIDWETMSVEENFWNTIRYDLTHLPKETALALCTTAYIRKTHGYNITNTAFFELVGKIPLFLPTPQKHHKLLAYYLTEHERPEDANGKIGEKRWTIHKDDLAEGIVEVSDVEENEYLENMAILMHSKSEWISSNITRLLGKDGTLATEQAQKQVEYLLGKKNKHHSYMDLVTNPNNYLQLTSDETWAYITRFLDFCPDNQTFGAWIIKFIDKERATQFFKSNVTYAPPILIRCFNVLGKTEQTAKKTFYLLQEELKGNKQAHDVICGCLKVLGEEAKDIAGKLLEKENQDKEVLCKCLKLLGKTPETEAFAQKTLQDWEKVHFSIVLRCLSIIPTDVKSVKIISEILHNKKHTKDTLYQYRMLLRTPFLQHKGWVRRVKYILGNWQKEIMLLVNNCLHSYAHDLESTKIVCEEILQNWEERHHKHKNKSIAYILRAFAHPYLRDLATQKANEVLEKGEEYIGKYFYAMAEKIVHEGIFPDWEQASEAGEEDTTQEFEK